jgi:hypothetical protein
MNDEPALSRARRGSCPSASSLDRFPVALIASPRSGSDGVRNSSGLLRDERVVAAQTLPSGDVLVADVEAVDGDRRVLVRDRRQNPWAFRLVARPLHVIPAVRHLVVERRFGHEVLRVPLEDP